MDAKEKPGWFIALFNDEFGVFQITLHQFREKAEEQVSYFGNGEVQQLFDKSAIEEAKREAEEETTKLKELVEEAQGILSTFEEANWGSLYSDWLKKYNEVMGDE